MFRSFLMGKTGLFSSKFSLNPNRIFPLAPVVPSASRTIPPTIGSHRFFFSQDQDPSVPLKFSALLDETHYLFDPYLTQVTSFSDGVSCLRMWYERDPLDPAVALYTLGSITWLTHWTSLNPDYYWVTMAASLAYGVSLTKLILSRGFLETTLTYVPFAQAPFNQLMRDHFPELGFSEMGNCYGHLIAWHEYWLKGKSYIDELNTISTAVKAKESLTTEQSKLIKTIPQVQKAQFNCPDDYFNCPFGVILNYTRRRVITLALNRAFSNPQTLVALCTETRETAHIFGFVADKNGQVTCFDSENGQLVFADRAAAQKGLSRLLAYKHAHLPNLSAYYRAANSPGIEEVSAPLESSVGNKPRP